jgi:AraC family transcriptional regulator
MNFEVVQLEPKKLIGKSLSMSFVEDRTGQLWASFAPKIASIPNRIGGEKISLQFYSDEFMTNPTLPYSKWATVEVTDFGIIPEGIETLEIEGGLYAVFHYKGSVLGAPNFFRKIFVEIIPNSNYQIDNLRPHFELLPAGKYDPMDENSEEDVFIPIKLKE